MSGKWLLQESKDEWHSSGIGVTTGKSKANTIKVLCEQTRELTDDLHDFLDYV